MFKDIIIKLLEQNNIKYKIWKSGTEIRFKCIFPEHNEVEPSCSINTESGKFGCFGCGRGGNIFTFFQLLGEPKESISDILSDKNLLLSYLLQIYKNSVNKITEDKTISDFKIVLKEEFKNFIKAEDTQCSIEYLTKERNLNLETIRKFNLMFAIKGQYENRIIIPFYKENTCIGFTSRTINKYEKTKYLHFVCKPLFDDFLFGFNLLSNNNYFILVEGVFDLMYLWQHGFRNVLSPLGTNIRMSQFLKLLSTDKIIFCFDADKSGKEAVIKNAKEILKLDNTKQIFHAILPDKKDPDNCTKEELKTAFDNLKEYRIQQNDMFFVKYSIL